jgi:ketosteroid isomerase-like protein
MNKSVLCAALLLAAPAYAAMSDADQIKAALNDGCKAFVAGDAEGIMAPLWNDKSFVDFDLSPPRAKNFEELKRDNLAMKDSFEGTPICEYLEIHPVILSKDAAYSMAIMRAGGKLKDGPQMDFTMRSTDVWRKIKGKWKIVHEHNSFPANPVTGQADLQSKP